MRISSSSSMLLAALAISASSPSLTGAAPTSAGMPDGGLTPSQSARDVSELNSPVPVARYDDSDSDVEIITARSADGDCNGAVRKILKPVIGIIDPLHLPIVPGLLGDLSDTLDKALGTCEKKAGAKSFQASENTEDENMVQLQNMVAQAVVDAMDVNAPVEGAPQGSPGAHGSESASSDAPVSSPSGPPNTPAMSSDTPVPSNAAREIFQRRGVAAPSVSASASETPSSSGYPIAEATQSHECRQEASPTSSFASPSSSATASVPTGPPPPDPSQYSSSFASEPSVTPMAAPDPPTGAPPPPAGPPQPPADAPKPPVSPPSPPSNAPAPPVSPPTALADAVPALPVSAPVNVPIGVPAELPIDAPVNAPVNTPIAAPVAHRKRADAPSPPEAPPGAGALPIAAPVDLPVGAPVGAPVALPINAPVNAPVEAPVGRRMERRHRAHPRAAEEDNNGYDSDGSSYSDCSSVDDDSDEAYRG